MEKSFFIMLSDEEDSSTSLGMTKLSFRLERNGVERNGEIPIIRRIEF